jgi:hypothetical protein
VHSIRRDQKREAGVKENTSTTGWEQTPPSLSHVREVNCDALHDSLLCVETREEGLEED